MEMSDEEIVDRIKKEFEDKILDITVNNENRIYIQIDKDTLEEISSFIKHELGFLIPDMCTGIDYKDHIQVIWHVGTSDGPTLIGIKVDIDREESTVPALTPIWEGFNWHEREAYDLLGINFVGHPDLRRILLPENWEGHPLREDYVYKKPTYRKPEDFE